MLGVRQQNRIAGHPIVLVLILESPEKSRGGREEEGTDHFQRALRFNIYAARASKKALSSAAALPPKPGIRLICSTVAKRMR